jgi:metallo-beta-lactamase family protein
MRHIDTIYVDSPLGKKYKEIFLREFWSKYKNINTNKIKFISVVEREALILRIKKWHRVIILSSSWMLQWGTVMNYLPELLKQKKWKIIFTWYSGKNTLAWQINDGNKKVIIKWVLHNVLCDSKYVTWFSSHADHDELVQYSQSIQKTKWAKIVLEHWWETRKILAESIKSWWIKVIVPQEWDKIRIL